MNVCYCLSPYTRWFSLGDPLILTRWQNCEEDLTFNELKSRERMRSRNIS